MALHYVQISGEFVDSQDNPLSGTATFTPNTTVYAAGIPVLSPDVPVQAEIVAGALKNLSGGTLQLLATDNSGLSFAGQTGFVMYTVTVVIGGQTLDPWSFFLPFGTLGAGPIDLYSLANTGAGGGGGSGTVTSVSVVTANGLAGTVATPTTTPAITLSTTITGLLKGNGTAVSAASAGTDYLVAPVTIGQGGTGQTTQQAALDAIAGAVTSGQVLRGNGTHVQLAAIQAGDVPTLNQSTTGNAATATNLAGAATFPAEVSPHLVTLTDAATVLVNAALGNEMRVTLGGNRTIGAPSNPTDGQSVTFEVVQDSSGSRTVTWTSGAGGYSFGGGSAPTLSTAAHDVDFIAFRYSSVADAGAGVWCYLGSLTGY